MKVSLTHQNHLDFDSKFGQIRSCFKGLFGGVEISYILFQFGLVKILQETHEDSAEYKVLKIVIIVNLMANCVLRALVLNNCTPEGIFKGRKCLFYPLPLNNLTALFLGIIWSRSNKEPLSKSLTAVIMTAAGLSLLQNICIIYDHHLANRKKTLKLDLQRSC